MTSTAPTAPSGDSAYTPRRARSAAATDALWGWFFVAPFLLVAAVFLIGPIFYSAVISFYETTLYSSWFDQFGTMRFVGFGNYRDLFADTAFWWSLVATAVYAALVIPTGIFVSLLLALALNPRLTGYKALRSAFFLPHVFDVFVVGVIWLLLYQKDGPFDRLFQLVGVTLFHEKGFLGNPYTILPSIAFAMVVKGMGFGMILFTTALNNVPDSIFEAADIDGCSPRQKFWHVTVPMLRPMILFQAVTGLTGVLNAFTEFYAFTNGGGGPPLPFLGATVQSARTAGFHLFRFFDESQYGHAAAMSFILLGVALAITAVNFRVLGEREQ